MESGPGVADGFRETVLLFIMMGLRRQGDEGSSGLRGNGSVVM